MPFKLQTGDDPLASASAQSLQLSLRTRGADMLLVSEHPSDFHFCCYGEVALESSDDAEESLVTDQAMDILGFLPEEKCGSYKLTGAIMHFGNVKLKQKPREEQMEADGTESVTDPYLVLQQLRCDGVLEGIRTCREGFPNWMPSADFKQRYCILNPEAFPKSKFMNSRKADEELLGSPEIDYAQYHLGITKRILEERHALLLIQWNIKTFRTMKDWPWMRLFKIKPLVQSAGMRKQVAGLEEECVPLQEALGNSEGGTESRASLPHPGKNDLLLQLQAEQETLANVEEQFKSLIKSKIQLEARFKALSARVEEEEEINSELTARGRKLEDECSESKKEIDDLETILAKPQKEKRATEHKVGSLREEVKSLHEDVSKLNRTAEAVWEAQQQTPDALRTEG
uniref:Myosin heavy chain 15 n=1 Tax=Molossus molossus TaxID=27622 RepID=A0A7J8I0L8_MOLMO|nr:myosin heavy chain 15 [Molossus molossus]